MRYPSGSDKFFRKFIPKVLEGLVSTSKWPRNGAKFLASSRPRPRKTRIKSLVLKMAEKKAEIPRNSSSRPQKGRGKGKYSSPRLVLDLGKVLPKVSSSTSSSLDDPSRTSELCSLYILGLYQTFHSTLNSKCWHRPAQIKCYLASSICLQVSCFKTV